ncbi:zeta toxin family protein [Aliarcobacter vitoriensis]|uniref:Zeta toxin domain-containing protein n=1 Tax=Aliarcobacter vitoriensis TaxID=2011099 RepID=A0A366MQN5_9BACT|nr:zeta toxin family protein [Aliarcobacter vitoriensis]RBQ28357.1 hypothetical protein CRU91_09715 [Aliarcobacter vitoriensis]
MQNRPKAFIFVGANASGKSTFISHLLNNKIIAGTYINPDLILKEELKLEETKENYIKAFKIAEDRRNELLQNNKDMIVETVFSTQEKVDFLFKLKEKNYDIVTFFTNTEDEQINVLYLYNRVKQGGHDVPIKKLIERKEKCFNNVKKSIKNIDCLILIDNSRINEPPIIVKSISQGNICFDNLVNLKINWIDDLTKDLIFDDSNIQKSHLQLCNNIINSMNNYKYILTKTYNEKNKILQQ